VVGQLRITGRMFMDQRADLRREKEIAGMAFPVALTFLSLQRRLFSTRRTPFFSPWSPLVASLVATPRQLRDHAREINRRRPFHPD
jgi:hypothetical protein